MSETIENTNVQESEGSEINKETQETQEREVIYDEPVINHPSAENETTEERPVDGDDDDVEDDETPETDEWTQVKPSKASREKAARKKQAKQQTKEEKKQAKQAKQKTKKNNHEQHDSSSDEEVFVSGQPVYFVERQHPNQKKLERTVQSQNEMIKSMKAVISDQKKMIAALHNKIQNIQSESNTGSEEKEEEVEEETS